jgi:hypothetical protein
MRAQVVAHQVEIPTPPREFAGHDWRDAPAAPLDVVAWLDERDRLQGIGSYALPFEAPTELPPRPVIMRTHRLRGPHDLDAEIGAMDVEIRASSRTRSTEPLLLASRSRSSLGATPRLSSRSSRRISRWDSIAAFVTSPAISGATLPMRS